jgi:type I restriction enzyme S subunit
MSLVDWDETTLGDAFDVRDGTHDSPKYHATGYRLMTSKNLKPEGLYFESAKFISQEDYDKANKRSAVSKGDVLMAMIGTIGNATLVEQEPDFAIKNVALFKLAKGQNGAFLKYYLDSVVERMWREAKGTTQKFVSLKYLRGFPVALPPKAEQKRIVSILDEAFSAIAKAKENAEKNLANARELFESYLNRVFTQQGPGWQETTIGEICEKVEYGTATKSQPTGKIPVLRMGNMQNREVDWGMGLVYTDNAGDIAKYELQTNDVLFNRTNSAEHVGKTCIYRGDRPAIFAGYLIRIRYHRDRVDGEYLNYYLNSDEARDHGKTVMSKSVNQANINGTKLKAYRFPLAPLEQQRKIVERFNELRAETGRLETIYTQKLANLDELKQSLLPKPFTGQLTAAEGLLV